MLLDKLETPHFVLVVGARGDELLVSDPARGIRTLSVDELEASCNHLRRLRSLRELYIMVGTHTQQYIHSPCV